MNSCNVSFRPYRLLSLLTVAFVLPIAGLGLRAISQEKGTGGTQAKPAAPVREIQLLGFVQPYEQTGLYSRVPGFIEDVKVDIGAIVKKGDVLATIDAPELGKQIEIKKARVEASKAEVQLAGTTVQAARASAVAAEARVKAVKESFKRSQALFDRWDKEFNRTKELLEKKAIEPGMLEEIRDQRAAAEAAMGEAKANVLVAEAAVVEARCQVEKSMKALAIAETNVEVAKAEFEGAAILLGFTSIAAPFDGVVTKRTAVRGELVVSPEGKAKAEPLFVVDRADVVRVVVNVPETDAPFVKVGAKATVAAPALDKDFTAKVSRVSWALETASRTMRVEIDLPNPDRQIRPGMQANVTIFAGK